MGISVEPQTFTIRGGSEHHKFGDPYEYVVTAVKNGEHSIRFIGLVKRKKDGDENDHLSITEMKMIRKYFHSIGIFHAEWERVGKDGVHTHGADL